MTIDPIIVSSVVYRSWTGIRRSGFRVVAVLLLVLAAPHAHAAEEIHSFHSDIRIQTDGSLEVTETIENRCGSRRTPPPPD